MESDVFTLMARRIKDQKEQIEQALAAGNARSYEEYCKLVGGYAALVDVEAELLAIEQRYLEN